MSVRLCSICMHVLTCRCEHPYVHGHKPLYHLLLTLSVSPMLASQQALGPACLHLPPQCWAPRHALPLLALYLGAGDLKSDPHRYTASTLLPSKNRCLQPLDCVCLTQIKCAVQDSWQGTIFNINCGKAASASQEDEFFKSGIF